MTTMKSSNHHLTSANPHSEAAAARKATKQANFRNHLVKPVAVLLLGAAATTGVGIEGAKAVKGVEKWYASHHDPVAQPDKAGIHKEITLGQEYKVGGKPEVLDSLTEVAHAAGIPDHNWHLTRSMLIDQVHDEGFKDADVLPAGTTIYLPSDSHVGIKRTGE